MSRFRLLVSLVSSLIVATPAIAGTATDLAAAARDCAASMNAGDVVVMRLQVLGWRPSPPTGKIRGSVEKYGLAVFTKGLAATQIVVGKRSEIGAPCLVYSEGLSASELTTFRSSLVEALQSQQFDPTDNGGTIYTSRNLFVLDIGKTEDHYSALISIFEK